MDILNFIILIIIFIMILYKNYLFSYFNKKGENLATKEDIEEITKKIKNIENKLTINFRVREILLTEEIKAIKSISEEIVKIMQYCENYGPNEHYFPSKKLEELPSLFQIVSAIKNKTIYSSPFVDEDIQNALSDYASRVFCFASLEMNDVFENSNEKEANFSKCFDLSQNILKKIYHILSNKYNLASN